MIILKFFTAAWPFIKPAFSAIWKHIDKLLIAAAAAAYAVYLIMSIPEKKPDISPIDNFELIEKSNRVLKNN